MSSAESTRLHLRLQKGYFSYLLDPFTAFVNHPLAQYYCFCGKMKGNILSQLFCVSPLNLFQGHPTTVFGEISVRSPLEWLEFSEAQEPVVCLV